MVDLHDDPIELVDSRHETWVERYESQRKQVQDALEAAGLADSLRRIEHVGSTAVPGLAAKDIVDLDVVVEDGTVREAAAVIVDRLGGTRYDNHDGWNVVPRREDGQRFNVHVFAESDDGWKVSVATRDVLRERDDLRDEYGAVKRRLADETNDLGDYSRGKTALVEELLEVARDGDYHFEFTVPESA
ncbi:GrpB family protein [Haloarchaeobius sp. FL176]|uniref:GrpB family protein n=1 Tax=Haloarchaeobius sp. FL176 TaxID=2967129 RepID=UPI00214786BF|nr:GrpB family protein [Haloarchaeobius sp. FL176]